MAGKWPRLAVTSQGTERQREGEREEEGGRERESSLPVRTLILYNDSALMTSSKRNHIPMPPPPTTRGEEVSDRNLGGTQFSPQH